MAQHQERGPVPVRCEVMQVRRSGFYASLPRQPSAGGAGEEAALMARVTAMAAETRPSYGSRRMAKHLQAEGFAVGRYHARRLMRQAQVTSQRRKKRGPVTTDRRHSYAVAPNLLTRQFDVDQPDRVWVGDITDVWTTEGWLYLAVLLDLSARKVVGWAMSSQVDTAFVQEALQMALGRRRPAAGLLHHADRGSQYACSAYQAVLAAHGIRGSMSRKGDGLDNAVAERFFGSLKGERMALQPYAGRQEAREEVVDYSAMCSHSKRLHSYLGYRSPTAFEESTTAA